MLNVQMLHIRSGAEHATLSARKQLRSNNTTALLAEIVACSGIVESLAVLPKRQVSRVQARGTRFWIMKYRKRVRIGTNSTNHLPLPPAALQCNPTQKIKLTRPASSAVYKHTRSNGPRRS